jgi:hypothetical protein
LGRHLGWPVTIAFYPLEASLIVLIRLADAFGFEVLCPEGFAAGAKYLLKRGYR